MKLKCNRKELYEAVQIVEAVVASTATRPILQDIRINAGDQGLELSATDLEVGIRYFAKEGIDVLDGGTVVVPGARIGSILREWAEEKIELTVEENICHLVGQDSHFKLFGSGLEMFPSIPDFAEEAEDEESKPFVVRGEVIAEMIRKTAYAVAVEGAHQNLRGVLLTAKGDRARMVATDGRRLAWIERGLEEPTTELKVGIVPVKGLNHLLKVLSVNSSGVVKVQLKDAYFLAKTERAVVCCRLIEGQYPNVDEVIPSDNDKKVEFETERLLSAVKRAALLTSSECKVIRFRFEPDKLMLSSEAANLGEARVELSVPYTGESFDIGFNPDFIIDTLRVIAKGKITMELKQPNTAGVIKDEQGYLSLIMPINLSQE